MRSWYAILVDSGAFVAQGFSGGTDACHHNWVELEFTGRNHVFPTALRWGLRALTVLGFLVCELGITASEAVVRDVTVDLMFVQVLQRERITEKHSAEKIRSLKLSETSSDHPSQLSTERDILAWFELEREKVG